MNQRVREKYSLLQRIHTVKAARVGAASKEKPCFRSVRVARCLRGMKKRQQRGGKSELFSAIRVTARFTMECGTLQD